MAIRQRTLASGDLRYEVRWSDGSGRRRSRLFDSRKDAERFETEIRRQRQLGVDLALEEARRQTTVADVVLIWLEVHEPKLTRPAAEDYARQLDKRILPELGHRRVRDLTGHEVDRWIAWMRDQGDGDATINKALTVLQRLLSIARGLGLVQFNAVSDAERPSQRPKRIPVLIGVQHVELMRLFMLGHGWTTDVMLLELLAYAGLRPESEAITLRWRQVRDRSLLIRSTKTDRDRSVKPLEPLAQLLDRSRGPDSDLVIPAPAGKPDWTREDWRNWRTRRFRPAAAYAGLPAGTRPRDLRGSFASLLINEGRSIVEVAAQLGHSPEIALRHYLQAIDDAPEHRMPADAAVLTARHLAPRLTLSDAYLTHDPSPEEE